MVHRFIAQQKDQESQANERAVAWHENEGGTL